MIHFDSKTTKRNTKKKQTKKRKKQTEEEGEKEKAKKQKQTEKEKQKEKTKPKRLTEAEKLAQTSLLNAEPSQPRRRAEQESSLKRRREVAGLQTTLSTQSDPKKARFTNPQHSKRKSKAPKRPYDSFVG